MQVRLEKSALFHPNQAMSCLSLLHVRGLPESPDGQNRLHALDTLIDLTGTEQARRFVFNISAKAPTQQYLLCC